VLISSSPRLPKLTIKIAPKSTLKIDCQQAAWRGGSIFAAGPDFERWTVCKADYEECGHNLARARMFN
jgi:actin-related protein